MAIRQLDPDMQFKLYCSFRADPWSMLFQLVTAGVPGSYCVFDGPRGSIEHLPDGAFVLLRQDESPDEIGIRFGGTLTRLPVDAGRNQLYRLKR